MPVGKLYQVVIYPLVGFKIQISDCYYSIQILITTRPNLITTRPKLIQIKSLPDHNLSIFPYISPIKLFLITTRPKNLLCFRAKKGRNNFSFSRSLFRGKMKYAA